MKAEIKSSGNREMRGYGRSPYVNIELTPENELERAVLRMAYSGKRELHIWSSGDATIEITMPRGKN
jgi:hypothetical protein